MENLQTMSLRDFIGQPRVRGRIRPLRPPPPRAIPVPLRVAPPRQQSRGDASIVGGAFDYLLRFELQRRAPHAVSDEWVAAKAAETLWRGVSPGTWIGEDPFYDPSIPGGHSDQRLRPEELGMRARKVVDDARAVLASHLKTTIPDRAQLAALAAQTVRLARLDAVYRRRALDPDFDADAPRDQVTDLLRMLDIVPWVSLVNNEVLILNPTFGSSSKMVGGADGDLIAGDLLVDFKTTRKDAIDVTDLDQLLGYFLLSRHERKTDPDFPSIRRVGLYYARRGYLWWYPVSKWTEHPEFPSVEDWFVGTAAPSEAQSATRSVTPSRRVETLTYRPPSPTAAVRHAAATERANTATAGFLATGEMVAGLREQCGCSVAEFADLIQVTPMTVRRWEARRGHLNLHAAPWEALQALYREVRAYQG